MAGLLDWVDPAREWFKSRPEVAKGLLGAVYQLATDPQAREAAMARYPVFDRSQSGQQMMDNALNAGPSGLLGKIVYHGSPHKFDKFDASNIGKGEGAQAYGHGVYLADSRDVAKSYMGPNAASSMKNYQRSIAVGDSGPMYSSQLYKMAEDAAKAGKWDDYQFYDLLRSASDSTINSAQALTKNIKERPSYWGYYGDNIPKIDAALKRIRKEVRFGGEGNLYKADLPDEWIPKMLDWDKPLSQQSDSVKAALRKSPIAPDESVWQHYTGQQLLEGEMQASGPYGKAGWATPEARASASRKIYEAGIPGIRYLDGGSRPNSGRISMLEQTIANLQGKGASKAAIANAQRELDAELARASYNYVVFPGLEDQVKILERNGVPLTGLLGR